MSGTSLDGIDAAVLEVRRTDRSGPPAPGEVEWRLVAFGTTAWPEPVRARIRAAMSTGGARDLAHLHVEVAEHLARALRGVLEEAGLQPGHLTAVGSHGQTVWHSPPRPGSGGRSQAPGGGGPNDTSLAGVPGATLQLGCSATLAERLGIDVVADFRARDVAAGGQGAPLVPWADRLFFHEPGTAMALQNLGGMGNVTWLPPEGHSAQILAFDTGPGVALVDEAVRRATGGASAFDAEGQRALRGRVDRSLLDQLLTHPFFRIPPPRSTGREAFGEAFVDAVVERMSPGSEADWDDLISTLTAFTVSSVALSYRSHLPLERTRKVILTGGGARNPALVAGLRAALHPLPVQTGARALGMDPDAREAAAFALMAWAHLEGVPANVPAATGASGARILGHRTPGHRSSGHRAPGSRDPGSRASGSTSSAARPSTN